jgi:hypothetical protein
MRLPTSHIVDKFENKIYGKRQVANKVTLRIHDISIYCAYHFAFFISFLYNYCSIGACAAVKGLFLEKKLSYQNNRINKFSKRMWPYGQKA